MGKQPKIDKSKPYLSFDIPDDPDGEIEAEAHNTNLPVEKCSKLTLDILKGVSAGALEGTKIEEKRPDPVRRRINKRIQGSQG